MRTLSWEEDYRYDCSATKQQLVGISHVQRALFQDWISMQPIRMGCSNWNHRNLLNRALEHGGGVLYVPTT
jgi:hypothetical protein